MMFKIKTNPTDGDIRFRKHFCLLPFEFEGYIYWLETIIIKEIYVLDTELVCEIDESGWYILDVYRKRELQ